MLRVNVHVLHQVVQVNACALKWLKWDWTYVTGLENCPFSSHHMKAYPELCDRRIFNNIIWNSPTISDKPLRSMSTCCCPFGSSSCPLVSLNVLQFEHMQQGASCALELPDDSPSHRWREYRVRRGPIVPQSVHAWVHLPRIDAFPLLDNSQDNTVLTCPTEENECFLGPCNTHTCTVRSNQSE